MISINLQSNPIRSAVGSPTADSTIINSGFSGTGIVTYRIQNLDADALDVISISSTLNIDTYPQIIEMSVPRLSILLKPRTNYRVRVHQQGGSWSAWTSFKSRDKRYQTPDATASLSSGDDDSPARRGNRTIVVTNNAKATVTNTATGATVINSDETGDVNTMSITETARGATVVNRD